MAKADKWALSKSPSHTVIEMNRNDATECVRQAMYAASKSALSSDACAKFVKGVTQHAVELPLDPVVQQAKPAKAPAAE